MPTQRPEPTDRQFAALWTLHSLVKQLYTHARTEGDAVRVLRLELRLLCAIAKRLEEER